MFLDTIKSPGLAHISYVIGSRGEAAVVDPRRDIAVYLEAARRHGARIVAILETHRNEDLVSGGGELALATDAPVLHGRALDVTYGRPAAEGERLRVGGLAIDVLETPGHTDDSLSFVVRDLSTGDAPLGVFTGDALFVGAVGRSDFYPDRPRAVAEALYDSLFGKLLPLGDQCLVWPAHGAGSVCGSNMAERDFSTIGQERLSNPALQVADRAAFVRARQEASAVAVQPPYFREMERLNTVGAGPLVHLPLAAPLPPAEIARRRDEDGLLVVDIRAPEAFCGAHIPDCVALPLAVLSGYAGWVLPYDRPLALVADGPAEAAEASAQLTRMGYDGVVGWLDGGLHAWEVEGRPYATSPALHARDLKARLDSGAAFTLLDVRGPEELAAVRLPGATEIFLGDLPDAVDRLPAARPVVTFCGSGLRATVATSLLQARGVEPVETCLGSLAACKAVGCPLDQAA